jgi:hypothetical protein
MTWLAAALAGDYLLRDAAGILLRPCDRGRGCLGDGCRSSDCGALYDLPPVIAIRARAYHDRRRRRDHYGGNGPVGIARTGRDEYATRGGGGDGSEEKRQAENPMDQLHGDDLLLM